jgi:hypothetical protein
MWKVLIFFLCFNNAQALGKATHLQELQSAFPYGLLTDDFGVLTKKDLKENACIAQAQPFSIKSQAYSYWQCFEAKNSRLVCEGNKYDSDEKKRMTLLVLQSKRNGELHDYMTRRPRPVADCRLDLKEWRRLLKNQKYICVSGQINSIDIDQNGGRSWFWILDKYKTKLGWDGVHNGKSDCEVGSFNR